MNRLIHSSWFLLIPLGLYFGGIILSPSEDISNIQKQGYAEQEEYIWTDSEGEEHEGQTLTKIEGLGVVLTYRDIYFSVIALSIPFLAIGRVLYGENQDELKSMIFGNCVMGLLLIGLSTKSHVASTIMFWAAVFSLYCIRNPLKKE